MRTGKIIQVSGSVVDVRFPHGELPRIREALSVELNGKRLVMEVEQHLSAETVRCIMLSGSEGLSRGMTVTGEGSGLRVPVGKATLGRLFNVFGDTIDGGFVAVKLMNALSTGGLSLKTTDKGKGNLSVTVTGSPRMGDDAVPMEWYYSPKAAA